jgi:hypothetical protein
MRMYLVRVAMTCSYDVEADNEDEAERLVQNLLPSDMDSVDWVKAELQEEDWEEDDDNKEDDDAR